MGRRRLKLRGINWRKLRSSRKFRLCKRYAEDLWGNYTMKGMQIWRIRKWRKFILRKQERYTLYFIKKKWKYHFRRKEWSGYEFSYARELISKELWGSDDVMLLKLSKFYKLSRSAQGKSKQDLRILKRSKVRYLLSKIKNWKKVYRKFRKSFMVSIYITNFLKDIITESLVVCLLNNSFSLYWKSMYLKVYLFCSNEVYVNILLKMYKIYFSMMYLFMSYFNYTMNWIIHLYDIDMQQRDYNNVMRLLQWRTLPLWKKQMYRKYSSYDLKLKRRRRRRKVAFFERDKLRMYHGRLKAKDYKFLLRRMNKKGFCLKHKPGTAFVSIFEKRLCSLVYKMHFFPTIFAAKQAIKHGRVCINFCISKFPNLIVNTGSIVSVVDSYREIMLKDLFYRLTYDEIISGIPKYVEVNYSIGMFLIWRDPEFADVYYPTKIKFSWLMRDVSMFK